MLTDDPISIVLHAVFLLAAGMYPMGMMLGSSCSPCCGGCRNDTCEGFDLEEAFGPDRTTGRIEFCSGFEYVGGGVFDFPFGGPVSSIQGFPQRGCRVYGPGIAEGTVVTEVDEIQDPPKQPYVLGPKRGCCDIQGLVNNNPNFPYRDRDNRTEQGCLDQRDIVSQNVTITSYEWNECVGCNGAAVGPAVISGGLVGEIVGARVTVSPAPEEPIGPCISFCGTGGLCGPYPRQPDRSDQVFGPFGSLDLSNEPRRLEYRRNCVRWVCRCYEGTGKQGQPLYPNPEDWYAVASTTVAGGPTVNNLDLGDALTSNSRYQSELNVEQEVLFSYEDWQAAEGETKCLVFAFIFYGLSEEPDFVDLCNLGPTVKTRKQITSGDDVYEIVYCNRCS
jgi:hypothetical protein